MEKWVAWPLSAHADIKDEPSNFFQGSFLLCGLRPSTLVSAVTEGQRPEIFPGYKEHTSPGYFHRKIGENQTKRNPWQFDFPSSGCTCQATWNLNDTPVTYWSKASSHVEAKWTCLLQVAQVHLPSSGLNNHIIWDTTCLFPLSPNKVGTTFLDILK